MNNVRFAYWLVVTCCKGRTISVVARATGTDMACEQAKHLLAKRGINLLPGNHAQTVTGPHSFKEVMSAFRAHNKS